MIPDTWINTTIGEIASVSSGGTQIRKEPEYWNGEIPWVTTSLIDFNTITDTEEHITQLGVDSSSAKVFPAGTLLMAMFGQGVTRGKVAILGIDAAFNQACVAIVPKNGISNRFLFHNLATRYDEIRKLSNTGSQENLNAALIKSINIVLPTPTEIERIVLFADCWDRGIRQLSDLIAAKLRFKQGLMQQLLTGGRRFKEFHDKWRTVHLKDVAEECEERNRGRLGTDSVMAVKKAEGIVPMRERTIAADIDRYSVVKKDYFAYNPMRLNIGSIARWSGDRDVLVSPDYVVFHCKKPTEGRPAIDTGFLDQYRRSSLWERYVTSSGNGSVRVRIYFSDLGGMKLNLPSMAEQRKIAAALNTADREIDLLRKKLDALKTQKKGLMQKLLTGQVRVKVPPELKQ